MEGSVNNLLSEEFWRGTATAVFLPPHSSLAIEEIAMACGESSEVVFQSSGSTAKPKLLCHTRAGLLASAEAVNQHLHAKSSDVWLCPLPVYHVGGFGIFARACCSGSEVYQLEGAWR